MKNILKAGLLCMLFVLFPCSVNAEETKVITGFEYQEAILDNLHIAYEQKPAKEELIQVLPQQMNVYLDNSSEITTIDVTWSDITGDYDTSNKYYYQFSPVWDYEKYTLDADMDLYKDVPYVAVFFYVGDCGLGETAATKYKNETVVYEFLRDNFDLNTAAICGILANLQKESDFNPNCYYNDTGNTISYGLCQWNSGAGRYGDLKNWCKENSFDYTTLDAQLQFMKYELTTDRYYKLSVLESDIDNSADGAYEASMLFSKYYEGCSSRYYVERANLAKNTYWPAYCHLADKHDIFNDLSVNDWFYDAVDYVNNRKVMTGMSANLFGPYEGLSRAQFVVILHRMVGSPAVTFKTKFSDISKGTWYSDAVAWANNGYIVTGYTNGCFGPADYITREQMATILYRFAKGLKLDASAKADLNTFADGNKVSSFAKEAMEWAAGKGIIIGKENGTKLSPQSYTSRAEGATMIKRFCEAYEL